MTAENCPKVGTIGWCDLTVSDVPDLKDFYEQVVGWTSTAVSMGDYDDYCVESPVTGETVAGICHARGVNESLPAQWLIYITVEDLSRSVSRCLELGGEVMVPARNMGRHGTMCVIKDPAGAVAALIQLQSESEASS